MNTNIKNEKLNTKATAAMDELSLNEVTTTQINRTSKQAACFCIVRKS